MHPWEKERVREVEKGGDMGVYIGRWKQEGSKKEGKDGKEGWKKESKGQFFGI